jgi:CheY-like chemotaxis protein
MHVLICDDDGATRFLTKRLLTRRAGCTFAECGDGAAALRLIGEQHFDLVLLDVEMPHVDGLEALTVIRKTPASAKLPVIMLSKERREEVVVQLVALGVSGYILKPMKPDKLLSAVEHVVGPAPVAPSVLVPDLGSVAPAPAAIAAEPPVPPDVPLGQKPTAEAETGYTDQAIQT